MVLFTAAANQSTIMAPERRRKLTGYVMTNSTIRTAVAAWFADRAAGRSMHRRLAYGSVSVLTEMGPDVWGCSNNGGDRAALYELCCGSTHDLSLAVSQDSAGYYVDVAQTSTDSFWDPAPPDYYATPIMREIVTLAGGFGCSGSYDAVGSVTIDLQDHVIADGNSVTTWGWRARCEIECTLPSGESYSAGINKDNSDLETFAILTFPAECTGATHVVMHGGGHCGACYFTDQRINVELSDQSTVAPGPSSSSGGSPWVSDDSTIRTAVASASHASRAV